MSKEYVCDCCRKILENPYAVKMKEFYIGCECDSCGIFPVNRKITTKIHLCENCYKKIKYIKGGDNK